MLERRGFAVVAEAEGARAGLDAVEAVTPDAVVLDVNLSDGNGIDVCRALTEANPALRVLLVSAHVHNGRWAGDCGGCVCTKPRLVSADLGGLLRRGTDEDRAGRPTG